MVCLHPPPYMVSHRGHGGGFQKLGSSLNIQTLSHKLLKYLNPKPETLEYLNPYFRVKTPEIRSSLLQRHSKKGPLTSGNLKSLFLSLICPYTPEINPLRETLNFWRCPCIPISYPPIQPYISLYISFLSFSGRLQFWGNPP